MLRNAKVAASLSPAPATEKTSRSSVWRVNPRFAGEVLSCALLRPPGSRNSSRSDTTCPKVRDMENEVRRARRTSAPFGWKASGLQALPAGLFFCFFGASGLPVSSGCGGIPPKCVRMQVRSTRPCSAVGRYIPLHEASCVRRAGRRSGAVGSSVTEGPMTKQHREALQVQSMHQEGEAALRRLQEHDFGLQENDCRPCF